MAVSGEVEANLFRSWHIETPPVTRKVYLAYSTERPLMRAPQVIGELSWTLLRRLVASGVWTAELSGESLPDDFGSG